MPSKKHRKPIVLPALMVFVFSSLLQIAFGQQTNSTEVLKAYVLNNQQRLGITKSEADNLSITYEYVDETTGIRHIYATQKLNGLAITNTSFSLHSFGSIQMDANRLLRVSSYSVVPAQASVRSKDAILKVFDAVHYTGSKNFELKQNVQGAEQYTVYKRSELKIWDIPCRLVYYNDSRLKSLVPAWEVQMMDLDKRHYWLSYIDATSGKVLKARDVIQHCSFDGAASDADLHAKSYHGKTALPDVSENYQQPFTAAGQQSVSSLPGNKYRVYDIPYENPIDPGVTHFLSSTSGDAIASPDGWHKVNNAASYNFSRGNNVFAFWDQSPGPLGGVPLIDSFHVAYPTNRTLGVPPVTEPYIFDFGINPANEPTTYLKAAIVNLFYWNNLMHDVFYYMGFTEAAGNFEESHTFSTRTASSGTPLDAVLAQAQDGGGTNNANFLALPDGISGQMQMYLWTTASPDSLVQVVSSTSGTPAGGKKFIAIQGSLNSLPTGSVNLYTNPVLSKQLVLVKKSALSTVGSETEGCTSGQQSIALPPSNDVMGKIAVIDRGTCSFVEKVLGAQLGGAVGAIIINNTPGAPQPFGGSDAPGNLITIPAVMISQADGAILKTQLQGGAVILASLKRSTPPAPNRDGDIDNGVISHEYGHGISNRLTGGPMSLLPLGGDEQGGEGWSDFVALYMTLRTNDLAPASSTHPFGFLRQRSIGNYVTYQSYSGQGIREFPYSPDMSVNPSTFSYIKRPDYSETHSVGFVWCSMLYEMLQNFIDKYGMSNNVYEGANPTASHNPPSTAKGNNIATRLVIEGMKLQPTNPTFIEERNAILKADTLLYNGQHACMIWKAFAKRGLGFSASSGSNALGDEVEAFDLPFSCDATQKRVRIVKTGPGKVINNSTVPYTIKVTNLYPVAVNNVSVSDTLPQIMKIKTTTGSPVVKGKIIKWTFNLAANETKTFSLVTTLISPVSSVQTFSEDNEDTASTLTANNGGGIDKWTLTTDAKQAFSGSKYWFVPDTDLGGSNTNLKTKNPISIPANAELVFAHKYATEEGYDGGVVEISTDNINWTYLPPNKFVKGGYSSVIPTANNPRIGTADLAAFSGASDGYQFSIAKLDDYANQSIYVRFRMTTDAAGGSVTNGGWWIDDIYVLVNRTEVSNRATAVTTANAAIMQGEGTNATSSTTAFILGSASLSRLSPLTPAIVKQSVDLKWQATNEEGVSGYEIERKESAQNDFVNAGFVSATNIGIVNDYLFTDHNVVANKKYQYRIKQVKSNAQPLYTNIAVVDMSAKIFRVSIYPNPSATVANINIENPQGGKVSINIYDVTGKKLTTLSADNSLRKVIALPVEGLRAGTYWVEVNSEKEHKTLPLIKMQK